MLCGYTDLITDFGKGSSFNRTSSILIRFYELTTAAEWRLMAFDECTLYLSWKYSGFYKMVLNVFWRVHWPKGLTEECRLLKHLVAITAAQKQVVRLNTSKLERHDSRARSTYCQFTRNRSTQMRKMAYKLKRMQEKELFRTSSKLPRC